jgi:poly(A) polymerase
MKPTSIKIIEKLRAHGFEAYWAGGCVRDILMGHEPKDYDIVTSAKPEEIEKLLEFTKPVGKEFGVILVIENGKSFEVATFRSDSGYSDGRRPDAVMFTDAKNDALRRDFTINGMFYDPIKDEIFDYVGGQKDLEARLIRFIGDPHVRINEDHLRILRAVRFKNQFEFQFHPDTYDALKQHGHLAAKVSAERIRDELNKMIEGPHPAAAFEDLSELGILKWIIPEMEEMHGVPQPYKYHKEGDVWKHSLKTLEVCHEHASRDVKWACLLHDIGKPATFSVEERIRFNSHTEAGEKIIDKIFKRLKFPRKDTENVKWLVERHMMMMPLIEMPDAKARKWFLREQFLNLMHLFEADVKGTDPSDMSLYNKIYERFRKLMDEMPEKPKPLLTGEEIMKKLNLEPGPIVGWIMNRLEEEQLAGEIKTRKEAINWLKSIK